MSANFGFFISLPKNQDVSVKPTNDCGCEDLALILEYREQQNWTVRAIETLRKDITATSLQREREAVKILASIEEIRPPGRIVTPEYINHIRHALEKSNQTVKELSQEVRIVRSLQFKAMSIRHSKITDAYHKTFKWVFGDHRLPPSDPRSKIGLRTWLESGSGIFWVSGKAGSGKSTLMKWLYDEPHTIMSLETWAGQSELSSASFYFWNAGTDMQKSQLGLLRSLLHELLTHNPDVISQVCHARWNTPIRHSAPWTLSELKEAFSQLRNIACEARKFCFFIDGLDEYEGDHFELIEVILETANSPYIKLCVSSRPWNCFEDAFGKSDDHKLYLQDLTRQDIEIYVKAKLTKPISATMARNDHGRYQLFTLEIVDRAEGVFLWVYLVVRSLLEGLSNGDNLALLERRLRSLPTDLERFFDHIIGSVDKIYEEKLGVMFKAALEITESTNMMIYSFMDEDDLDFSVKLAPGTMRTSEILSRQEDASRRINGRTKGLLEATKTIDGELFNQYSVDFLHRTVRDYLTTPTMRGKVDSMIYEGHNIALTLCKACLAMLKTMPAESSNNSHLESFIERLDVSMHFVRQCITTGGCVDSRFIQETERTCKARFRLFLDSEIGFKKHLVQEGLLEYFAGSPSEWTEVAKAEEVPILLRHALLCPLTRNKYKIDLSVTVNKLLATGISPNYKIGNGTIWEEYLGVYGKSDMDRETEVDYQQRVFETLLLKGADIFRALPLIKSLPQWTAKFNTTQMYGAHFLRTVEVLLSHGLDPNIDLGDGRSLWQFINEKLNAYDTFYEHHFEFGIQKLFLLYGANPFANFCLIRKEDDHQKPIYMQIKENIRAGVFPKADALELGQILGSEQKYWNEQGQWLYKHTG